MGDEAPATPAAASDGPSTPSGSPSASDSHRSPNVNSGGHGGSARATVQRAVNATGQRSGADEADDAEQRAQNIVSMRQSLPAPHDMLLLNLWFLREKAGLGDDFDPAAFCRQAVQHARDSEYSDRNIARTDLFCQIVAFDKRTVVDNSANLCSCKAVEAGEGEQGGEGGGEDEDEATPAGCGCGTWGAFIGLERSVLVGCAWRGGKFEVRARQADVDPLAQRKSPPPSSRPCSVSRT